MKITTIKQAFSLLIPKRVGHINGGLAYTRPNVRAALILLIADGRTCIVNATIYTPPGALIDARNPRGTIFVGNVTHNKTATHPLPEFSLVD